jgi:hypothetical protein
MWLVAESQKTSRAQQASIKSLKLLQASKI